VRLHTNVWNSLNRLEKFIFTEWKFHNPNTLALSKTMNEKDREMFGIDVTTLDWDDYFADLAKGVRVYLNNEPLKTLPAGRKKDRVLLVLHILLQLAVHSGLWWLVATIFGTTMMKSIIVLPISYFALGVL
jgi:fatty acyl-CoA reductase